MPKLFDRVKVNVATMGQGPLTFGPASSPAFMTPLEAGAVDGDNVRYILVEGTDFEEGVGSIFSSGTQMNRVTVTRSKIGGAVGNGKMNLTGTALLALTASSADMLNPDLNLSDLKDKAAARAALGVSATGSDASYLKPSDVGSAAAHPADDFVRTDAVQSLSAAAQKRARSNVSAFGVVRVRVFASSTTYVPDPKLVLAIMEGIGGGGGGGGIFGQPSQVGGGGGGGAGGYSMTVATAAMIGASQPLTIGAPGSGGNVANGGAGGDTSIGTLLVAKGGSGGLGSGGTNVAGGAGGGVGTGTISTPGQNGGWSLGGASGVTVAAFSGAGGSSRWGSGGMQSQAYNTSNGGLSAVGYGSGGGGAAAQNTSLTAAGGPGSQGLVLITEFCSE